MTELNTNTYMLFIGTSIAFLTSLALTLWVKSKARLDAPNHRSSHTQPTPTGGGLGIAVCACGALLWLGATHNYDYYGGALGIALLAYTSWRDDAAPLSPQLRLLVQLFAACAATIPFLVNSPVPAYVWPLIVLALMWLINLYNFMDGTDGIAGIQGLILTLGLLLIHPSITDQTLMLLAVSSAAILAFLMFNWPPARIFMGDVGSTVLGLFFGLILLTASNSLQQLAAGVILLAGFITDASWTLAVRLLTRQRVWEAHRLHYYQKMARKSSSHKAPLATYVLLGTLVQWPLAFGAIHADGRHWIIYLTAAITVHFIACWYYKAGLQEQPMAPPRPTHQLKG